ncbi:ham-2 [Pristionchus pacificus]|uniref:Ztf-30 n=1 Tax=Pristionchus pacificus TaxID=54126 RepID=A0A2A6BK11_PRIPA|nr:ham-2 [Pristionchus pacificus]|eukprot:PDM66255.1 ztf-30 [Pristionchus pacificus]
MPYRAELKRPDLKGQFPCSVCGKIFCHSSSLSRHRMQAHFKSYTCTQCNTDISSNETLRSHLFRVHSISRMFMCRCCNWAFPDKTSLHIHMQSMLRNGQPGEVPVLARSSTEGDPGDEESSPPHESKFSSSSLFRPLEQMHPFNPLNAQSLLNSLKKSESPSTSSVLTPAQLLNVWLTNNPFMNMANPMANLQTMAIGQEKNGESSESQDSSSGSPDLNEDDYIEINIKKEDLEDEMAELDVVSEPADDSFEAEEKKEERSGSMKRKATKPVQMMEGVDEEDSSPLKLLAVDKTILATGLIIPRDASSPTVSDSHTSSGSSGHHGMDSPPHHHQHHGSKCFDCQELKSKLTEKDDELRTRTLEVVSLTGTVDRLQKQILLLAQTCKQREMQALQQNHMALLRANMLRPVPVPIVSAPSSLSLPPISSSLPQLNPEMLKRFVDQFVQNNQAQPSPNPPARCT